MVVEHDGVGLPLELLAARLALGCLLEVVAVAAAAEWLETRSELTGDALGARVELATGGSYDPLEDWLELRCTDRRRFRGGDAEEVAAAVADEHVAVLPLDPSLRRLVARSEGFTLRHPPTCRSVSRTLRFGRELDERRTGVPFESFGLPLPSVRLVRTLLVRGADAWAVARRDRLLVPWIRGRLGGSAGLAGATAEDVPGLVTAGRVMLRAWLRLQAAGFGVQPMSFCSLTLFATATGALPEDAPAPWPAMWREAVEELRPRLGGTPCWAFRVGRSSPLPADLRTPRLPLEEVYVTDQTSRSPTRSRSLRARCGDGTRAGSPVPGPASTPPWTRRPRASPRRRGWTSTPGRCRPCPPRRRGSGRRSGRRPPRADRRPAGCRRRPTTWGPGGCPRGAPDRRRRGPPSPTPTPRAAARGGRSRPRTMPRAARPPRG